MFKKLTAWLILPLFGLISVYPYEFQLAQAQGVIEVPTTSLLSLTSSLNPAVLKGIKIYPEMPFRFDFILDPGDSQLDQTQLTDESKKLIRYFLAALTVPQGDLWVNLSPYEKDRIVPQALGQTEMGRDLLAQDYLLKQLTSSLLHPEGDAGKKFWDSVYNQAYEKLGTIDIPLDTFNKVWIVPQQARVYQNGNVAYVAETRLKVLLEDDYVARANAVVEKSETVFDEEIKNTVREVIIPILEEEVNGGQHFMILRQIYHALILAKWYEKHFQNSVLGQSYTDLNKTSGIEIEDKEEKFQIWQQYVTSFKTGLFDLIKEEYDLATQQIIPKKYFSGGMNMDAEAAFDETSLAVTSTDDFAQLANRRQILISSEFEITSDKAMINKRFFVISAVLLLAVAFWQTGLFQEIYQKVYYHSIPVSSLDQEDRHYHWFQESRDTIEMIDLGVPLSGGYFSQAAMKIANLANSSKKDAPFQFYRVNQQDVYFSLFSDYDEQAAMYDRMALFIEIEGYRGKILTDEGIEQAKKDLGRDIIFSGHNYSVEKMAEFFTEVAKESIALNPHEDRLLKMFIDARLIRRNGRTYTGVENVALLSFVADAPDESIMHELDHGLWMTDPNYRAAVHQAWQKIERETQERILNFLVLHGYDISDPELVEREFSAYYIDIQMMIEMHKNDYSAYMDGYGYGSEDSPSPVVSKKNSIAAKLFPQTFESTRQHFFNFQYNMVRKDPNLYMDTTGHVLMDRETFFKTVVFRQEYLVELEKISGFLGQVRNDVLESYQLETAPRSLEPESRLSRYFDTAGNRLVVLSTRPQGPVMQMMGYTAIITYLRSPDAVRKWIGEQDQKWQPEMNRQFNAVLKESGDRNHFEIYFSPRSEQKLAANGYDFESHEMLIFEIEALTEKEFNEAKKDDKAMLNLKEESIAGDRIVFEEHGQADQAMPEPVGGIDLNELNLETDGQANAIQMPSDPAMLKQPIQGLVPRILFIGEVSLYNFLGLNVPADSEDYPDTSLAQKLSCFIASKQFENG